MMELTIERSRWLRGKQSQSGLLVDGKMCCLGFLCKKLGATDESMEGISMPNDETCRFKSTLPEWLQSDGIFYKGYELITNDVELAAKHNDSANLSDHEREVLIADLFARHDIQVKFVE